jgi:mannose/fructose-specific phosphotransferase system component IIA
MSDAKRPKAQGVVFAHGDMARGLVDAVKKISGQDDALIPMSNEGRSIERLRSDLEAVVGEGPTVIFTDLQAGSCALTALGSSSSRNVLVLCGTNLPMLLDFVFHRDTPLDELATRLVSHGQQGIKALQRRES